MRSILNYISKTFFIGPLDTYIKNNPIVENSILSFNNTSSLTKDKVNAANLLKNGALEVMNNNLSPAEKFKRMHELSEIHKKSAETIRSNHSNASPGKYDDIVTSICDISTMLSNNSCSIKELIVFYETILNDFKSQISANYILAISASEPSDLSLLQDNQHNIVISNDNKVYVYIEDKKYRYDLDQKIKRGEEKNELKYANGSLTIIDNENLNKEIIDIVVKQHHDKYAPKKPVTPEYKILLETFYELLRALLCITINTKEFQQARELLTTTLIRQLKYIQDIAPLAYSENNSTKNGEKTSTVISQGSLLTALESSVKSISADFQSNGNLLLSAKKILFPDLLRKISDLVNNNTKEKIKNIQQGILSLKIS